MFNDSCECYHICKKFPCGEHILGEVLGNGIISIFDVLEILKYIVRLDSAISDGFRINYCTRALNAALISETRPDPNIPNIFDVLEILKYLVKIDGVLKQW